MVFHQTKISANFVIAEYIRPVGVRMKYQTTQNNNENKNKRNKPRKPVKAVNCIDCKKKEVSISGR